MATGRRDEAALRGPLLRCRPVPVRDHVLPGQAARHPGSVPGAQARGQYLFNVWDGFEHNPAPRITHETVASFFASDPPQFYTVPFGFHDPGTIGALLEAAGFGDVRWEAVEKIGVSPSAAEATLGLIDGNPIHAAIQERRPEALVEIKDAVARNLATQLGDRPLRCALRALVFSARRPADRPLDGAGR